MLCYLLFWAILGFIIHFYSTFGTNLLTGGPAQICCFMPISVFRRKGISNGVETERNQLEKLFWKESYRIDLDPTSGELRAAHEGGGAPNPLGRAPCLVPSSLLPLRTLQVFWIASVPEITLLKVHSVWIPFDIPFLRNTEIGKKTAICTGPWVSRLVPKII